ncbi:MAG TPA: YqaJ viral recombinase family protein [Stellaceae bacterium]|jgi:hypothetical protein|nr:YqaJ viral recombinase family protein [Stellaceae bacterium]
MRVHKVKQGGARWHRLRLGKVTASEFNKIVPLQKGGWSAAGKQLMYRLVAERLMSKEVERQYVSQAMIDGIEREPYAAAAFRQMAACDLDDGGFFETWELGDDEPGRIGCSPDRIIRGTNTVLEIKCPEAQTHVGYMIGGPGDAYQEQCQGQMLIGGWEKVHFFSWFPDPRIAPYWQERPRDDAYIAKLTRWLADFCEELDKATEFVRRRGMDVTLSAGELELTEGV